MSVELRPAEGSSQWPCCSELPFCGEAGWTPVTFTETLIRSPPDSWPTQDCCPLPSPFLGQDYLQNSLGLSCVGQLGGPRDVAC